MSTQQFICEFCNRIYQTAHSLSHHQKYSKYCLEIQNKKLEHTCQYCERSFSSIYILQTHLTTCKLKKTSESMSIIQERDLYKAKTIQQEILLSQKETLLSQKEEQLVQKESQIKQLLDLVGKLTANSQFNATHTNITNTNSNNTTTNTNSNNTTTTNNYNTQFTSLFNNLVVFNCNNVVDSIKELKTSEHISTLDLNDIQKSLLSDIVANSINKFTFCTDSRRKVMVIKNASGYQTRTKLDDFLADYIHYGKDEIHNYLDTTHNHINDMVNNDELQDEAIWYNFDRTREELDNKIKDVYKKDNIKDTELIKHIQTHVEKDGTKIKKGR